MLDDKTARKISEIFSNWIRENDPEFYTLITGRNAETGEKIVPSSSEEINPKGSRYFKKRVRDTRDKLDKERILDAFEYSYENYSDEQKLQVLCNALEDRHNGFHINDKISNILKKLGFASEVRCKPTKLGKKFYLNFYNKHLGT